MPSPPHHIWYGPLPHPTRPLPMAPHGLYAGSSRLEAGCLAISLSPLRREEILQEIPRRYYSGDLSTSASQSSMAPQWEHSARPLTTWPLQDAQ